VTDWSQIVDPARLERVPVVLRVEGLKDLGADKYGWVDVRVIETIKNTSGKQLGDHLSVAYYSGKHGVPLTECTVYLEPYNDSPDHPWKLLGGDATLGVSHVKGR
jgi:hypothetical protein